MAGPAGRLGDQKWKVYRKLSEFENPSERFVLLDMRGNSINAGNYRVDMNGWPDKPQMHRFWQDYPGVYHNDATMFSFADGHCEKKALARRAHQKSTRKISGNIPNREIKTPNNRDIQWMQQRTTRQESPPKRYVGPSFAYTAKLAGHPYWGF